MTLLIALHAIRRRHPDFPGLVVSGYDVDGEPIMRVCSQDILPGTVFDETDEESIASLVSLEAVRELTADEFALFESKAS